MGSETKRCTQISDRLTISSLPEQGYVVIYAGIQVAAFTDITDLTEWLNSSTAPEGYGFEVVVGCANYA